MYAVQIFKQITRKSRISIALQLSQQTEIVTIGCHWTAYSEGHDL